MNTLQKEVWQIRSSSTSLSKRVTRWEWCNVTAEACSTVWQVRCQTEWRIHLRVTNLVRRQRRSHRQCLRRQNRNKLFSPRSETAVEFCVTSCWVMLWRCLKRLQRLSWEWIPDEVWRLCPATVRYIFLSDFNNYSGDMISELVWILNCLKEIVLQVVRILKGIWNLEAQPFESRQMAAILSITSWNQDINVQILNGWDYS